MVSRIHQLVSGEPVKWSAVPPPLLKVGYTFYRNVAKIISSFPTRGGAPTSYLEQSGMCNYLFAAYTLIPTTILCQWILIAVMRLWFIFNLPRSSSKVCQNVFSCGIARDVTSSVASESLDLRLWLISVSSRVYSHLWKSIVSRGACLWEMDRSYVW